MIRIIWSKEARRDIRAIAEYFENESPAYAESIVRTLYGAVGRLEQFPKSGRTVPEIGNELFREVIVAGYRIVYLTSEDGDSDYHARQAGSGEEAAFIMLDRPQNSFLLAGLSASI